MSDSNDLGDPALAVFAFAAYHQLESGQAVTKVIREDGKGHRANQDGVDELETRGLAHVQGNDIVFSDSGLAILSRTVEGVKSAARGG